MEKIEPIGIYVHIPFCKSKCSYCDFSSFTLKNRELEDEYFSMLKREIIEYPAKIKYINDERISFLNKSKHFLSFSYPWIIPTDYDSKITVDTIYFGGGTPSFVDSKYIIDILYLIKKEFNVLSTAEITIEANPESVTEEKMKSYAAAGINRVSLGLQTTNNKLLKQIGRIHSFEQFKEAYSIASKYFSNINIDLIFGLPNQTILDVKEDLNNIFALTPEIKHLSLYSLILEENTRMYKEFKEKKIHIPDEILNRDMYRYIQLALKEKGFSQYEISNFAKKDYESRHNLNCWSQQYYLGFGLGSSSYFNDVRFSNNHNLLLYIQNIKTGLLKDEITIEEIQDKYAKMNEYMMLNFRKTSGFPSSHFNRKFSEDLFTLFKNQLEKLKKIGLIELTEIYSDKKESELILSLSSKGLDLANIVFEEFIF